MRNITGLLIIILLITAGCGNRINENSGIITEISSFISTGELSKASHLADSILRTSSDERLRWRADSLGQIAERIKLDFKLNEEQVAEELQLKLGDKFSKDDMNRWEETGWLENRIINGEKRYFNSAVANLELLKNFRLNRQERDSSLAHNKDLIFRKKHAQSIVKASQSRTVAVMPVEMIITYTLKVNPDAVPDGETIRCWLPYPKENSPRQKDVYLTAISNEDFILAPDTCVHRSIYMENKAVKGKPTLFSISYSYTSLGQFTDLSAVNVLPYNTKSEIYRKYTGEQLPHICFTDDVKRLADSIVGNEKDPREIVRKIYYWFNRNIPWARAPEYSIIPNIPEYVLKNMKGDCGMQTFLFISMLRYKGVPVHWQSGWKMPPEAKDLHDWCEIYYEGVGWIPADIYYNLQYSKDPTVRDFYISGIDSYRLIINDGVSGSLYPAKKFLRSEPFDFQRGEVEWNGGNLYFDKWDYNMDIKYVTPLPAEL